MKNQFLDFALVMAAVVNAVFALFFAVGFVTDPTFTVAQPRAAPESLVGTAFCLFIWVAAHAGLFIALLSDRRA